MRNPLFIIILLFSSLLHAQALVFERNSDIEDFGLILNNRQFTKFQNEGLFLRDSALLNFNRDINYTFKDYFSYESLEITDSVKLKRSIALINYKSGKSRLIVNPLLNASVSNYGEGRLSTNSRGLVLRSNLFDKFNIEASVLENQRFLTRKDYNYSIENGVVPGLGFWKNYDSTGADYFLAQGAIYSNLYKRNRDLVHFSFGNFSQKFGMGIRSLYLGGNTPASMGMRLHTIIGGRVRYTNYFSQLNGFSALLGNILLPKKFIAAHRLGLVLGKKENFEIGLFEGVIHSRQGGAGGFDLDYLNPIIFYRSVESNLGSADNSLVGIDLTYRTRFGDLYSQFVLDEFKKSEILKSWWANKYALQLGYMHTHELKSNYGHVARVEMNVVKPYTYGHYNPLNNYAHYNQALAHPYGANFRELILKYTGLFPKLSNIWLTVNAMVLRQGIDSSATAVNWGGDIRRSNDTRPFDYGVKMLQGKRNDILSLSISLNKMIWHKFSANITYEYRSETRYVISNNYISLGLLYHLSPANPIL